MKTLRIATIATAVFVASVLFAMKIESYAYAQGVADAGSGGSAVTQTVPSVSTTDTVQTAIDSWTLVKHYGFVWGGMLIVFALGTAFVKRAEDDHWLGQGVTLSVLTTALGVLGAAIDAKFAGGPWAAVPTTLMGGILLIVQQYKKPVKTPATSAGSGPGGAGGTKLAAIALLMLVIAYAMPSCAAAQLMAADFATCEKTNIGQEVQGLPAQLVTDLAALNIPATGSLWTIVTGIVNLNAPTLEVDLALLIGKVGIDAVDCIVTAIEAVVNASGSGSGSGSATPSTKIPAPTGAQRARAVIKTYRAAHPGAH